MEEKPHQEAKEEVSRRLSDAIPPDILFTYTGAAFSEIYQKLADRVGQSQRSFYKLEDLREINKLNKEKISKIPSERVQTKRSDEDFKTFIQKRIKEQKQSLPLKTDAIKMISQNGYQIFTKNKLLREIAIQGFLTQFDLSNEKSGTGLDQTDENDKTMFVFQKIKKQQDKLKNQPFIFEKALAFLCLVQAPQQCYYLIKQAQSLTKSIILNEKNLILHQYEKLIQNYNDLYEQLEPEKRTRRAEINQQNTKKMLLDGIQNSLLCALPQQNTKTFGMTIGQQILINLTPILKMIQTIIEKDKTKLQKCFQQINDVAKTTISLTIFHQLGHYLVRAYNKQIQNKNSFTFGHSDTLQQNSSKIFNEYYQIYLTFQQSKGKIGSYQISEKMAQFVGKEEPFPQFMKANGNDFNDLVQNVVTIYNKGLLIKLIIWLKEKMPNFNQSYSNTYLKVNVDTKHLNDNKCIYQQILSIILNSKQYTQQVGQEKQKENMAKFIQIRSKAQCNKLQIAKFYLVIQKILSTVLKQDDLLFTAIGNICDSNRFKETIEKQIEIQNMKQSIKKQCINLPNSKDILKRFCKSFSQKYNPDSTQINSSKFIQQATNENWSQNNIKEDNIEIVFENQEQRQCCYKVVLLSRTKGFFKYLKQICTNIKQYYKLPQFFRMLNNPRLEMGFIIENLIFPKIHQGDNILYRKDIQTLMKLSDENDNCKAFSLRQQFGTIQKEDLKNENVFISLRSVMDENQVCMEVPANYCYIAQHRDEELRRMFKSKQ